LDGRIGPRAVRTTSKPSGAWHVQIGDVHGERAWVTRDRGTRGRPVMGRGHPEPLATTEFRKQFPRTHIVVYNERFFLGSCTYGI
jgi:hypothetical protein